MTETEVEKWLQNSINQLNIVGMYSKGKLIILRLQFSVFLMTMHCFASYLDMYYNCDTLDKYIECFAAFLPAAASIVFLTCFILNRHTLYQVVDILRNKFLLHNYSLQAEETSNRLVKYSQFYLYFVMVVYFFMSVQSYFEREGGSIHDAKGQGLPLRAYYPMDLSKKRYLLIVFLMEYIGVIVVVHITIPIAMCFASLLLHLRAQLFYLKESLITVCDIEDPYERKMLLNRCVKLHIVLIDFTEKMQSTFSSILAIHNYSPSIVISVAGFQASQMSVLDPKFLPYASQANYVVLECFIYCYYGQHVIDESTELGFMAYSNKWYNCPPDIAKDLNIILMICQKPLRMIFVGSASASLETFYNIMKTGYSYFMFLASMGAPNEM